MIYTINNKIMFCERNGTLWSINNPESQYVLTATAGRLLGFLLSKRGGIIIRDDILNTVWDSYGLRTSTHSLNKYISDLRKVFIKLGLEDEVIVTVPKVGFKITAAILIDNDEPFLEKDTSEQAASSEKTDSDHLVSKRTVHARSLFFLVNNIRGVVLFLFIIATILHIFIFPNRMESLHHPITNFIMLEILTLVVYQVWSYFLMFIQGKVYL